MPFKLNVAFEPMADIPDDHDYWQTSGDKSTPRTLRDLCIKHALSVIDEKANRSQLGKEIDSAAAAARLELFDVHNIDGYVAEKAYRAVYEYAYHKAIGLELADTIEMRSSTSRMLRFRIGKSGGLISICFDSTMRSITTISLSQAEIDALIATLHQCRLWMTEKAEKLEIVTASNRVLEIDRVTRHGNKTGYCACLCFKDANGDRLFEHTFTPSQVSVLCYHYSYLHQHTFAAKGGAIGSNHWASGPARISS